ncbi:hypothetical protein [Candidatus Pristimantibacillus sp. PTI5]|uniref:hypothetical protein n=1 Tax=Candidatus Pristimantibacillus sp. PTI5 TaxID=3400422 RepID=UPI003B02173F
MGNNKLRLEVEPEDEIIRLVGFASEKIVSIERMKEGLIIELEEGTNTEEVLSKIQRMIKQSQSPRNLSQQTVIHTIGDCSEKPYNTDFPEGLVKYYGEGLIRLKGEALHLLHYFDNRFRQLAMELGAEETQYPTLLPLSAMEKTGYLRTSPQYSMFVCHPREDVDDLLKLSREVEEGHAADVIAQPNFVLTPAACFHCYMDLEHAHVDRPAVYTFRQNVFRHEGRMNWEGFGRLRDYHVRELVFLGDEPFVREQRKHVVDKVIQIAEELKLTARVCVTSDPFIIPSMQKFKRIQLEEESKLELQLAYGPEDYLAAASFNVHGTAFTAPFQITIKDISETVTGCVGFGLERWVLAFLAQHGPDPEQWNIRINY